MSPTVAWRALRVAGFVCLTGCLDFHSRAVEETRTGLLGLEGRELRDCLGIVSDFEIDGDIERQTYRFERDDPSDDGAGAGALGGVAIGGRPEVDRRHDPHGFPIDRPDQSYCQLDFELTRGRVTRVLAHGRTREGMNADATCMLRAQRCLP